MVLLQEQDLGPGFAGAWIDPIDRGRVHIGFKGEAAVDGARRDPALAPLVDDPQVDFVALRFSTDELEAGIGRVVRRLYALLVRDRKPQPCPFSAAVSNAENGVLVVIDCSVFARRAEVEATLLEDLESGLVHLTYDKVDMPPPV